MKATFLVNSIDHLEPTLERASNKIKKSLTLRPVRVSMADPESVQHIGEVYKSAILAHLFEAP